MRTIEIPRSDRDARGQAANRFFALAAAALLFGFVVWRVSGPAMGRDAGASSSERSSTEAPHVGASSAPAASSDERDLTAAERATIDVFRRASPAVVHVTNVAKVALRRSFEDVVQGAGSGFVWDREGHVVTNFHVVRGSDAVYVRFAGDERPYSARIVNVARHQDLAVLELVERPSAALTALEIGRSSDLLVGQHVYAIGNPFGLDQTLSSGLISGLAREIRSITDHKITGVIQTDAAINPGNSGGPLLDSRGRLIGVNTAIVTLSGAYNGIGFAVPVDTVRRVVNEILATGRVTRPGLGVKIVSEQEAQRWRLRGVGVATVEAGSAAEAAGLRSATVSASGELSIDEIVGVEDVTIRTARDLFDALDGRGVGDLVRVRVRRGERVFDATVRLQELRE